MAWPECFQCPSVARARKHEAMPFIFLSSRDLNFRDLVDGMKLCVSMFDLPQPYYPYGKTNFSIWIIKKNQLFLPSHNTKSTVEKENISDFGHFDPSGLISLKRLVRSCNCFLPFIGWCRSSAGRQEHKIRRSSAAAHTHTQQTAGRRAWSEIRWFTWFRFKRNVHGRGFPKL